jgi:hypothetical protein
MKRRRKRKKRWIQTIHIRKGALHRQLGIPVGEKIPVSLLHEVEHEPGKLGHRARLALTLRRLRKRTR